MEFPAFLEDRVRPLRRREYDRLVELGLLEGERVELLYGRIVRLAPQGEDHAGSVHALTRLLAARLAGRADLRVQLPFVAPDESEPEPDLAIVPLQDPFAGHPERAHLVVEVSATSQLADRGPKGALYAAADVRARRVERYRRPVEGRYAESSLHGPEETLVVPGFPDLTVPLDAILPPRRG